MNRPEFKIEVEKHFKKCLLECLTEHQEVREAKISKDERFFIFFLSATSMEIEIVNDYNDQYEPTLMDNYYDENGTYSSWIDNFKFFVNMSSRLCNNYLEDIIDMISHEVEITFIKNDFVGVTKDVIFFPEFHTENLKKGLMDILNTYAAIIHGARTISLKNNYTGTTRKDDGITVNDVYEQFEKIVKEEGHSIKKQKDYARATNPPGTPTQFIIQALLTVHNIQWRVSLKVYRENGSKYQVTSEINVSKLIGQEDFEHLDCMRMCRGYNTVGIAYNYTKMRAILIELGALSLGYIQYNQQIKQVYDE